MTNPDNGFHSLPASPSTQPLEKSNFCVFEITFLDFEIIFLDVSNADKLYVMVSILWPRQPLFNFNAITFEMIFFGGGAAWPLDATFYHLTHESVRMW